MINKVVLVGRLTKDIELKKTPNNISTCNFTVACNRRFQSKQEGAQDADFINCVAWRQSADFLANYASKGSIVGVEGRIQTRSYDGQNGKVYVTEVAANNITFLGSRNSNSGTEPSFDDVPNSNSNNIETTDLTEDPFKDFGSEVVLSDDDLPF